MSKTRLQIAKEKAPSIPPNTCPYIDSIVEMLDDFDAPDCSIDDFRKQVIRAGLEYIRQSNGALRDSGKFWYSEYCKVVNKK